MIFDIINNWLTLSKQYFFTYRKGFFFLSYLSNSPSLIIESSKKFPSMKFDEEKQLLSSDNAFLKGTFRYSELEQGLWVMNSIISYKNNVSYTPIYDNRLPSDYYCLTLIHIVESNLNNEFYEFDGFKIENKSLSFLKPKRDFINCHFKGSTENQYIIYFSKEWADTNLLSIPNLPIQILDLFQNDEIGFINYKFNENTYEDCINTFEAIFTDSGKPNVFALKKITYTFFDVFINSITELQQLDSNDLQIKDRIKIQKIESFMIQNIYNKFQGIESLSDQFNISATKLKSDFKLLYGISIFKYFQSKQMDLALSLISEKNMMVKDVAKLFHYENVSKFSATFKNFHGFSPSKID